MTDNSFWSDLGIGVYQCLYGQAKARILRVGKGKVVVANHFDADREVVALFSPFETRLTCMPGSAVEGHELGDFPEPVDQ